METQKNNRPNQVFDDGKVFIGELKTYQDAENLPSFYATKRTNYLGVTMVFAISRNPLQD